LKEISLRQRAEVVSLVKSLGGEVRSMYVMSREQYLLFIFTFPGIKRAKEASMVLSKLTGISFRILPAVLVGELPQIMT